MSKRYRRLICLSDENYQALKQFGTVGDSFNDVMTQILKKIKPQQTEIRVGTRDSVCSGCSPNHPRGDDLSR
jgi:predicted CopG family antitoxin